MGGFSIYNLATKEEALAEVQKFMELHTRLWPKWEGTIELRPMYEEEDDVAATQTEASRQHQRWVGTPYTGDSP